MTFCVLRNTLYATQFQSDWPNMSKVKRKVRKGKEQHEDANIKSSSAPAGQLLCCVPEDIGGKIKKHAHVYVLALRFVHLISIGFCVKSPLSLSRQCRVCSASNF